MDEDGAEGRSRVVATRSFQNDAGSTVVATVFEPTMPEEDKWACRFQISGLPTDVDERAYGVDGMQALMMALEGIRVHLERSGATLIWLDGEPGVLGMTPSIPFSYGLKVQKHLTKLVDEEIVRLVEADAKAKGRPWPPGKP